jgi:hypothetical protein
MSLLMKTHSWRLERISSTTFPRDITYKLSYLTEDQIRAVQAYIRCGTCYRCRIGKGRFYFGEYPSKAIEAALNAKGE